MINKSSRVIISILILSTIVALNISTRGCPWRNNRNKNVGSSNAFIINAPLNLTAIVASPYQIDLSWIDNSNNEDWFEIERRVSVGGNWQSIATTTVTSYSDTGLFPYSTYYYRVRASNIIGDTSLWSNEANATTFNVEWAAIAAGAYHSLARTNSNTLYSWGANPAGQLGLGDTNDRLIPTLIRFDFDWGVFEDVATIAEAQGNHTISIKTDGTLWSCGRNDYGQLGTGDTFNADAPYFIVPDTDWSFAVAGFLHSAAIKTNRTIWSWGYNDYGQLGLGDTIDRWSPTQIGTGSDWSKVTTGWYHTIGIKTNGTIWVWGYNDSCQLGLGDSNYYDKSDPNDWIYINNDRNRPNQVGGTPNPYPALTATLISLTQMNLSWSDTDTEEGFEVLRGSTFIYYNGVTSTDYSLLTTLSSNVTSYSDTTITPTTYSYRVKAFNNVGESLSLPVSLEVTTNNIGSSNAVTSFPSTRLNSTWSMASAGSNHSIAIQTNGTIWVWGQGLLGLGSAVTRTTPSQIGMDSDWSIVDDTMAIKNNRTLWAWGWNSEGQLGLGDSGGGTERLTLTQVGIDSDWSVIATGGMYTLALKTDGTMWSWGYNEYGQLGLGDTNRRIVPTQAGLLTPDSPSSLTATVISSQQVNLTWLDFSYSEEGFKIERKTRATDYSLIATVGANIVSYSDITPSGFAPSTTYYYRIRSFNGFGDSSPSNEVFVVPWGDWSIVALGATHSMAIKTDGSIWSWGRNQYGQLGLGDSGALAFSRKTPTQIGIFTDWSGVSGGSVFTIARNNSGTIFSWGRNNISQLGLGDTINRITPSLIGTYSDWINIAAGANHTITLSTTGAIWVWGDNQYGQLGIGNTISKTTPTLIEAGTDWVVIASKGDYNICRKTDGTIWGWGYNGDYELGLTDTTDRWTPTRIGSDTDWSVPITGDAHTIAHKTNGTIWAWGGNWNGQLGLGDTEDRWTPTQIGDQTDWSTVAIGGEYTIALKTNRTIWAWGYNYYGQLGLGDTGTGTQRITPTQIGIDSDWSTVKAGDSHSIARKINGTIWSWGYNQYGQLGLKDTLSRNTPTLIGE